MSRGATRSVDDLVKAMGVEGISKILGATWQRCLDISQRRRRHDRRSIIITSRLPIDRWYEIISDPTIADVILDRLVHNAYRIQLTGESLRKEKNPATATMQA